MSDCIKTGAGKREEGRGKKILLSLHSPSPHPSHTYFLFGNYDIDPTPPLLLP
ncbi:MAG: hypothetical protein F6K02_28420 [Moorea sp. SIO3A5]|nr:hypothetical protein [Moorena sp. SIO3A5]